MHHSLRLYGRYQNSFLKAYITLAKLRGIPVIGSLVRVVANAYARNGHSGYLLTTAEAEQIIDSAKNLVLGPCSCRQVFHSCDSPIMSELVLGTGIEVFKGKDFQPVSKARAKEIVQEAHEKRLTHSLMSCGHHFYALCNCCDCCCVPTRLRQKYGIGQALTRNKNIVSEFRRRQVST